MIYEAEQPRGSVNENEEKTIPNQNDHEGSARTLPHHHSNGLAGYMKAGAVMSPEHARRGCEAKATEPAGRVVVRVGAAAPGLMAMRRADREARRLAKRVGVAGYAIAVHNVIDGNNGIDASKTKKNADDVDSRTMLSAATRAARCACRDACSRLQAA